MMNVNLRWLQWLCRAGLVTMVMLSPQLVAQTTAVAPAKTMPDVVPDTAPIPAHVKQRILDHMKQTDLQRLHGWPGIVFYCPVEEAKSDAIKTVCSRINAEVGSMMAASNIKFQVAKNAFDLHFLPHMTGRLLLVVDILATGPESPAAALSASVQALAHYAHAVNWSSELHPLQEAGDGRSPLEVPQHVNAVLWESELIVAGTGGLSPLEDAVYKGVHERIAAFLAEFVKVNPK
ncbi:hypothetical protein [Methylotetracoccus oryzae]|uniref:hypothetical protein n=1 Tax=Methylotetracoccus oryzae TaxID=1919059 RepID=UPI001F39AD4F|nr:hypothetical protein [Methylotetracoccus oryzae]